MKDGKFESIIEVEEYLSGDKIECLECGRTYKHLGQHLVKTHQMDVVSYREKYLIPNRYGLCTLILKEGFAEQGLLVIEKYKAQGLLLSDFVKRNNPDRKDRFQPFHSLGENNKGKKLNRKIFTLTCSCGAKFESLHTKYKLCPACQHKASKIVNAARKKRYMDNKNR